MKVFMKLAKFEKEVNIGIENWIVFKYIFIQATFNTGFVLVFFIKNTYTKNWYLTIGP
jgi:hypothetical protein